MYQCELYHHGIKGQKWGVRRFQDKNGRLTPAGRKRYSEDTNENTTQKKKMSTKKKVAIGVGVTAVVAGTYFTNRYIKMNGNATIKKGSTFQHMGRANEDLSNPFFASHLKKDNKSYAKNDFFGSHWDTQKTLAASRDLKIAGKKVTLETFTEWVNTSPVAKEKFTKLDTSDKKAVKRAYYSFNRNLDSPDRRDKEVFNDFYSALASKGYDAIRDMNDQTQSGMVSPIILFGGLEDIMTVKVKDLK